MTAEVVPGLYLLPGVGPGVGAYVWHPRPEQRDEGEPIVFDCGMPWSGAGLAASLVALGCQPEEVRSIAVTHDDIDHIGRLASLQAVSGAAVYAHAAEAPRLARTSWRMPPGNSGPVNWLAKAADAFYQRIPRQGVRVSHTLTDGDTIPGGWTAVHTPGHTPGHTSFFHPQLRILIAGDAIGYMRGRLRFPMSIYTEDGQTAADSIRKLAELEPDIICFGHTGVLRHAAEPLRRFVDTLPGFGA